MFHLRSIINDAVEDKEYMGIVENIINHPKVLSMKKIAHHGDISRYEHCVNVSYLGYKIAKKFRLDKESIARAGLLHDFFFYDWRDYKAKSSSIVHSHAVVHGNIACTNAKKYFTLSEKEEEMIKKHMWPITIIPPKYMMTYLIGFVDKYCAIREVLEAKFNLRSESICTDP